MLLAESKGLSVEAGAVKFGQISIILAYHSVSGRAIVRVSLASKIRQYEKSLPALSGA
jgi:hypothetical protein